MRCLTLQLVGMGPAGLSEQRTLVEQLGQRVVIGVAMPLVLGVIHNPF